VEDAETAKMMEPVPVHLTQLCRIVIVTLIILVLLVTNFAMPPQLAVETESAKLMEIVYVHQILQDVTVVCVQLITLGHSAPFIVILPETADALVALRDQIAACAKKIILGYLVANFVMII